VSTYKLKQNYNERGAYNPALSLHLLKEHLANPAVFYKTLPRPLFWDWTTHSWICTGYAEAELILIDLNVFTVDRLRHDIDFEAHGLGEMSVLNAILAKQMLFQDGKEHDHIRRLLMPRLHPRVLEELRHKIRFIVESLLEPHMGTTRFDLVTDFAGRLPTLVSAHVLGLPLENGSLERWIRWNEAFEMLLGSLQGLVPSTDVSRVAATMAEAVAAFGNYVKYRRKGTANTSGPDLLGAMIEGGLSDDEIAANGIVLLAGGFRTATQLIVRAIFRLQTNQAQRELLAANPELIDAALEETLRLDGSSQFVGRRALADRKIAGRQIRAGDGVVILLAAANRDPDRFPDPDAFDIKRASKKHLAFGFGAHYCWGAALARLEASIAVTEFQRAFPAAWTVPDHQWLWADEPNVRSPSSVAIGLRGPLIDELGRGAVVTIPWTLAQKPFEQHAREMPELSAIVHNSRTITYGALDRIANQLAHYLQAHGVTKEVVVGLCIPRSIDAIISIIAIWKAGGAYLPLDIDAPDRLQQIVVSSGTRLILTISTLVPRLSVPPDSQIIAIDTLADLLTMEPGKAPHCEAGAQNLAYVMFTSGSTGAPKGVEITHQGVANLCVAQKIFNISSEDRVLQVASLTFDASVFETILALGHGATLYIADARYGPSLMHFLREAQISAFVLTPSVLAITPPDNLPKLRVAMAAGEVCPQVTVQRWSAAHRKFYNLYGPTESTVWATVALCDPELTPTIGTPITNTEIRLLDEQGSPVSFGTPGILHIGGVGLMRGYRGDPERSRLSLVADSFAKDGARLYNTGDWACWTSEGTLQFRGRSDDRVKLHGVLIELGEIEAALMAFPEVQAAGAVVRDDRLLAFVVLQPGFDFDEAQLRQQLARRLPLTMLPARIFRRPSLPATASSDKLDRAALAELSISLQEELPVETTRSMDPSARIENELVEIYRAVLRRSDVDRETNFFIAGGDSLLSVELAATVAKHFDLVFEEVVRGIYDNPTAHELAAHMRLKGKHVS
jgi:amino acid adenylation domain-containing protein